MKLKGKNSKKLKGNTKAKMEKTLKKMEETRKNDTINLRAQIDKKIEVLIAEREKATNYKDTLNKKIIEIDKMSLRIDGAIVALKELVQNDTDV